MLRHPHGQGWIFLGLACSWIGDGGAYFIGSKWGRHKCLPEVCLFHKYYALALKSKIIFSDNSNLHALPL
jgi:hypothetical protein